MLKYDPLTQWLLGQHHDVLEVSFETIAAVVNGLPPSAYKYPAWWGNDGTSHVRSHAWLDAGFRTEQVDLARGRVTFRRLR